MRAVRSALLSLALTSACVPESNVPAPPSGVVAESITVTSRSFASGAPLPIDATCDGKNTSPDVTWSSPPEGTKALVVTLDDLEPGAGGATRWLVLDVKPEARSIAAGADVAAVDATLGLNDNGEAAYRGPCPGRRVGHHFALRVFALDRPLAFKDPPDREHVTSRMSGHVLGSGQVVGTVSR